MCAFISGSSILFHWPPCLFLRQYYAVFVTMTLKYNLKSIIVILTALLFLLQIALSIWGPLCFHMSFRIDISISVKSDIGILMGIILNL
jgi:hypothetical protein